MQTLRSVALISVSVCLSAMGMAAQSTISADQVVAKSLEARGGAARFAAIHSFHYTGHLYFGQGQGAGLEVWGADQPARIRIEVKLAQGTQVQGYDGHTVWQIAPGKSKAEVVPAAPASNIIDQAENFIDLIADRGLQRELVGSGTLEGHKFVKVRFTIPKTGGSFTQYFDTTTWLAFHEEYPGGVEDISGYHLVAGIKLPSRYVSGPVGRPGTPLDWQEQEVSRAPGDPARFKMPE